MHDSVGPHMCGPRQRRMRRCPKEGERCVSDAHLKETPSVPNLLAPNVFFFFFFFF
jgi:hypothetical protein